MPKNKLTTHDNLNSLLKNAHARLGTGHHGGHATTRSLLDFQCDFASAKDALTVSFKPDELIDVCNKHQLSHHIVTSQANDLQTFLMRPDLGRLLSSESHSLLDSQTHDANDCLLVVSGGLSPLAVTEQAAPLLDLFYQAIKSSHKLAPIFITPRSRVALADEINFYTKSTHTIILIGERPGLTTANSMGIYLTRHAKPGTTDNMRKCISNIHQHGLSHADACEQLIKLIKI